MKSIAACACLVLLGATPAPSPSAHPVSPAQLIARAAARSASVKSYVANVHAVIAMHSFPFVSPTLEGTYYHKEPNKNKIVFTSGLPFIAKQFSKVYPQVQSPAQWASVYVISSEGDDGVDTTLKLVPRKHGRVDHIDARLDDKTAEVVSLRWTYNDGGYATLIQTFGAVDGHELVVAQSGHFEVPHYDADLTSTFSDFRLNVPIPDSVFEQSS